MNKMIRTVLLFFMALMMFSCASKKNIENKPVNVNEPVVNSDFINKINVPLEFSSLKINSKIDIQTGNFIPTLYTSTSIENGKKIWMNISALLLNVGRGLATPEGIKGYEKWNKTYIDSNFDYLNNLLNVNFLDYQSLQNLLLGRSFIPINNSDYVLTENAEGYHLSSKQNLSFTSNGETHTYQSVLQYSPEADLSQIYLKEINTNESIEINYSNWITQENLRLPKNVKIIIKGSKNSQIMMENTIFAFTSMETPYQVPSNYTKTDIK